METSTNTKALISQKAMKMAHLITHLLKKAISTTNLLLPILLSRFNKLASKALESSFRSLCRPQNDAVHPSLKEYEFSCSNSPAYFSKKLLRRRHRYPVDEAAVAAAVQRVFDMLNSEGDSTPMLLPGLGKSPAVPVRQLRVTDSPFPVKENEEESKQVSLAADDFIRRFYRDLRREKSLASPSPFRLN